MAPWMKTTRERYGVGKSTCACLYVSLCEYVQAHPVFMVPFCYGMMLAYTANEQK